MKQNINTVHSILKNTALVQFAASLLVALRAGRLVSMVMAMDMVVTEAMVYQGSMALDMAV